MCYDHFYLWPLQLPLNVFLSQLLGLYAIYIQIYWWMPCVDGCKVMHYFPNNPQVATTLKKNDYPSSRSYQLPKSPSQRWASGALLFQAGIDWLSAVQGFCRQSQMLWIHECKSHMMCRREDFTAFFSIFWLLCCFYFWNVFWAFAVVRGQGQCKRVESNIDVP